MKDLVYQIKMNFVLLISFLFLFISCVGTIEDADPLLTKGASDGLFIFNFSGVYEAKPISDTKVDIFFYPATGEAKNITYIITYDGGEKEIFVDGSNLRPDYRGLLKYTYSGLTIGSIYFFRVQAKDKETGAYSYNGEFRIARTFINVTSDFDGISSIKNLSGYDGLTAVKVSWPEAVVLGSVYAPKEQDVREYVLTVIDADKLTPSDFDNQKYSDPIRKEYRISAQNVSIIANGLSPATRYYGRIRALHQGYYDNTANPEYKVEQNSDYIEFSTLDSDLSSLIVDLSNIRVTGTGENTLNLTWNEVQGTIDHYRIYYNRADLGTFETYKSSKDVSCSGRESNNPNFFCQKEQSTVSTSRIVDLESFQDYEINILICQDPGCTRFLQFDRKTGNTDLQTVSFAGIDSIELSSSVSELDSVILKYTLPDYSSGTCDGLLVEAKERATGEPMIDTILNDPLNPNTSSLTVGAFNYQADDQVKITGINYASGEPYCFSIYPFVWKNGAVEAFKSSEVVKCVLPFITLPDESDFPGIDEVLVDSQTKFVTTRWNIPEKGIYTNFALFIKNGSSFNFGDAVGDHIGYSKVLLPAWQIEHTFVLPPGTYSVGILAYCDINDAYSIYNSSTYSFTIE